MQANYSHNRAECVKPRNFGRSKMLKTEKYYEILQRKMVQGAGGAVVVQAEMNFHSFPYRL